MKDVTKWECWEDAKARIEAKKAKKAQTAYCRQQCMDSREDTSADTLTDCGGIKPLPLLSQIDEEEEQPCTEQF